MHQVLLFSLVFLFIVGKNVDTKHAFYQLKVQNKIKTNTKCLNWMSIPDL